MNLFELFAKLSLDSSEYEKSIADAENEAKSFSSRLGSGLKTAAKVGAAAITAVTTAATAFGGAIIAGTKNVAAYGDTIDKQSQKLGISAQAYQEWDAILQHSGASIDSLQRGMVTLSKAAENNTDAFAALGLSQERIAGMNQEELFAATIEGLQRMEEGTERTVLANKLLGGSAKELGALLNTSAEDTEAMRQKVHELGGVMSDEAVKASAAYQDSLQDMQTAFAGVKRNILNEFLPSVTSVMDGLTDIFSGDSDSGVGKINKGLTELTEKMFDTIPRIMDIASQIVPAIGDAIIGNLDSFAETGSRIILSLADGLVKNLPKLARSATDIIKTFASAVSKNIKPLISAFVDGVLEIINTLTSPDIISDFVDVGIEFILALVDGIIDAIPKLVEAIPKVIKNLVSAISRNSGKIVKAGIELMLGLAKAIVLAIPDIVKEIPTLIAAIAKGILDGLNSIVDTAANVLFDLTGHFKGLSQKISDQTQGIRDYRDAVKDVVADLPEYNSLLSDQGHSIDDLNSAMSEAESGITTILKKALQNQQALRAEDVEDIQNYLKKLRGLEEEKFSIYYSQQIAELRAVTLEADKITADNAQKYLANASEAKKASDEMARDLYISALANVENLSKTGDYTVEALQKMREDIQRQYDLRLADSERAYASSYKVIAEGTARNTQAELDAIEATRKNIEKLDKQVAEELEVGSAEWEKARDQLSEQMRLYEDQVVGLADVNAAAFFDLLKTIKSTGGKLPVEAKNIVHKFVSAFENLPSDMQKTGKDALLELVSGFTDEFPVFEEAADMSADELFDALRTAFDTTDFEKVGSGAADSVAKGLTSQKSISFALEEARKFGSTILGGLNETVSQMYGKGQSAASSFINGFTSSRATKEIEDYLSDLGYSPSGSTRSNTPAIMSNEYAQQQAEHNRLVEEGLQALVNKPSSGDIYMDGEAVGRVVDSRLGTTAQNRERGN